MSRQNNKYKKPPLELVIWANMIKWKMLRGVSDEMLCACLGVQSIRYREENHLMNTAEMGRICDLLQIEPEQLLDR